MAWVFMDLEMKPVDKQFRRQRDMCRQEVIEFGAVKLEEDLSEIDSFSFSCSTRSMELLRASISLYRLRSIHRCSSVNRIPDANMASAQAAEIRKPNPKRTRVTII